MSKTLQGDILSLSEAWVQSHKSALLNVVPIDHTKDVVDLVTTCAAQCQTGYDVSLHCTDAHVQTDTMSSIPLLHVPPCRLLVHAANMTCQPAKANCQ